MAKKAKSSKKLSAKASTRVSKKELEISLTDKFMEAVSGLGHDASKLGKDIKRISKQLAKKLSEKFTDVKQNVATKLEVNKKVKAKAQKKPITAPKISSKTEAKAEKVVAKVMTKAAANTSVKPVKRAYVRRAVKPVANDSVTSAPKTIVRKARANTKPAAAKPTKSVKAKESTELISQDAPISSQGNPQEQPNSTN